MGLKAIGTERVDTRAAWATVLLLAQAAACSSDQPLKPQGNSDDQPKTDAAGAPKAAPGDPKTQAPNPQGSFLADAGNAPSPSADVATCANERVVANRVPANVFFLLDISGSMEALQSAEALDNRWGAVRSALKDFLAGPDVEGLNVALNYFPVQGERTQCQAGSQCDFGPCITGLCTFPLVLTGAQVPCIPELLGGLPDECSSQSSPLFGTEDFCQTLWVCENHLTTPCVADDLASCDFSNESCESVHCPTGKCLSPAVRDTPRTGFCAGPTSCDVTSYQTPAVERTALPGGVQRLVDSLDSIEPDTFAQTPTHVALQGTYDHVNRWRIDEPDRPAFIVMATDGLPKECNSTPELVVDAIKGGSQRGMKTFVIGIADAAEEEVRGRLDEWAKEGGGDEAYLVNADGTIAEGFSEALDKVRGELLPCQYPIPKATHGAIDFDKVNVEVTLAGTTSQVPQASGPEECTTDTLAWYYNEADSGGNPTQVVLCPSACEAINEATGNQLEVVFGCKTVRVRAK